MSAQEVEFDEDLLPDDLLPRPKGAALPVLRTAAQVKRAEKARVEREARAQLADDAKRLAQIVNLHIAGYSLAQIGASIGASAEEVDRMLSQDMARYVRSQPALRTYVRNWVSERYMKMIDANWAAASDPAHPDKLENQDRVTRLLAQMSKLHGAEAPVQSEVKVDAAPESVERLVKALAAGQGLAYEADIFDIPEADIHEAVVVSEETTEVSGNAVEESDGHDEF
jgi:polysaccharide pyruvyl transferase WcaK-like protein